MKRREFITLLGGTAAWPFPGQAQRPTMPMVGYLDFYAAEPTGIFLTAFRNGLSEAATPKVTTWPSNTAMRTLTRIGSQSWRPI